MIVETARLSVDPARVDEFEEATHQAAALIASAAGYLGHEVLASDDVAGEYLLVVRWRSRSDHEEGFRGSAAYAEWSRLLHPFYDPVPSVEYWRPL